MHRVIKFNTAYGIINKEIKQFLLIISKLAKLTYPIMVAQLLYTIYTLHSHPTDMAISGQEYPAPDGGYGYMVLFSSTMVAFLNDGVGNSFGIMMPHLLEDLKAGVAVTSVAPGLRMAMFMFTGGCCCCYCCCCCCF